MNRPHRFLPISLAAGMLLTTLVHSQANDVVYRIPVGRKASTILIPKVEFRSTTVADGIEFLRQESVRLDWDPDVTRRGVNIYVKLPASNPQSAVSPAPPSGPMECFPEPHTAPPRITLMLQNVPLLEALRYIAVECGLKVLVDDYAICLVPPDTDTSVVVMPLELEEKRFSVSPEVGGVLTALLLPVKGDQSVAIGLDPMPWLRKEGISLPAGASAIYLPSAQQLVMRNTWENLDRTRALLQPVREAK